MDELEEAKSISDKSFLAEDIIGDQLDKAQYTVFLVEDDSDDRRQAVQTLKKSPYIYNVHTFINGDELMAHLAGTGLYRGNATYHIPTLIMLDIHIPGTDGLSILKSLKEHPLTEYIPVIILTGDTSNRVALDALRAKANAFITKPLNLNHVHEVIYKGWGWPPDNTTA